MVEAASKLDMTIKADAVLYEAARIDLEQVKKDYIAAVHAATGPSGGEREYAQRLARLDRMRALLAQTMTILDLARGDSVG